MRRMETSRRVVGGTPSSSSWRRVFLRATILPVALSLALYTFPYVPSPTFSSFSNASIADTARVTPAFSISFLFSSLLFFLSPTLSLSLFFSKCKCTYRGLKVRDFDIYNGLGEKSRVGCRGVENGVGVLIVAQRILFF